MSSPSASIVLLIHCKDRKGIVARVAGFIHEFGGNILDSDHHTDRETGEFVMRTVFSLEGFQLPPNDIGSAFAPIAKVFEMRYEIHFVPSRPKVALLVSKQDHCLADLLQRQHRGELLFEVPLIVSNHDACAVWAELYKIPFHVLPVTKETKPEQERQVLSLLAQHIIELVILARYMQILSGDFLKHVGCPVINIHHSFLPAFIGANPYRQAYERGSSSSVPRRTMRPRSWTKDPLSSRTSRAWGIGTRLTIWFGRGATWRSWSWREPFGPIWSGA